MHGTHLTHKQQGVDYQQLSQRCASAPVGLYELLVPPVAEQLQQIAAHAAARASRDAVAQREALKAVAVLRLAVYKKIARKKVQQQQQQRRQEVKEQGR
jgi:hypothetical protein